MCVVTERGDQCLLAWGRWAGRDGTMRRLGYPSCSAEQMAGRVAGTDSAVSDVEELVDRLVVGMLEDRKRLVAKFFYVDRMPVKAVAESLSTIVKARSIGRCRGISIDMVKRDLDCIRSMVGGVVMWSDKKLLT